MRPTGATLWLPTSVQLCVVPSTVPAFGFQLCPYMRLMLIILLNGSTIKSIADAYPVLHTRFSGPLLLPGTY